MEKPIYTSPYSIGKSGQIYSKFNENHQSFLTQNPQEQKHEGIKFLHQVFFYCVNFIIYSSK
jgi:hypothetical protein